MSKTALITGASSGIGEELAKIHAGNKGNLIIVARRKERLDDLKAELEKSHGVAVTTIAKDLSVAGSAQSLYDEIKAAGLEVDYLINNAGFGQVGKFHELSLERQSQMMHLNMVSLTELMHLYLPEMVARNSGKILNVSSTASLMPGPLQAVYYATKAYVTYLGNAVAEELKNTSVTVTNLMPGATETEFGKTSGMDKTSLFDETASARKVAEDGYNGMIKGELDVVSGLTTMQKIMLSTTKFVPKKVLLQQIHKMQEIK